MDPVVRRRPRSEATDITVTAAPNDHYNEMTTKAPMDPVVREY